MRRRHRAGDRETGGRYWCESTPHSRPGMRRGKRVVSPALRQSRGWGRVEPLSQRETEMGGLRLKRSFADFGCGVVEVTWIAC